MAAAASSSSSDTSTAVTGSGTAGTETTAATGTTMEGGEKTDCTSPSPTETECADGAGGDSSAEGNQPPCVTVADTSSWSVKNLLEWNNSDGDGDAIDMEEDAAWEEQEIVNEEEAVLNKVVDSGNADSGVSGSCNNNNSNCSRSSSNINNSNCNKSVVESADEFEVNCEEKEVDFKSLQEIEEDFNEEDSERNEVASFEDDELSKTVNTSNSSSQHNNSSSLGCSHSWRKRKQSDSRNGLPCKKHFSDDKTGLSSLKKKQSETTEKIRLPRSIIPSKDNPPPEITDWLLQFQRWSNAERLLAIDSLIEMCEPTQVRHMMQLIEPQFQRDFISLLPKELALHVLSFLEPRDLLRAAQTCRSWRFLAEDNLLWREKCKEAGVDRDATAKRSRNRPLNSNSPSSPWKAAFMRHHAIEMNWRVRPIRPPKVLKGHDDHVITCLQFSGNRIVSGSDDNTLKVWSATTGKCLRTLVGHTGGVWSSQMAGSVIISGSTDRTLKVWNAESGQCLHTLYGHTSTVRCMHLHGKKVVSGSRDATLRVWHIESGECLHVLVGHLAAVRCVQYDGKLVVSGAYDYMVKVWNPEREECLHTLQGHTNRVYSLQFDGVHVVSGSLDTSIRVWEVETGACRHTLMGHQSLTSGMELRNNILVSGNADSTVKVWDILTGQCLQTLSGPNKHQSAVTCLRFNNRFVITSSDDGTVKLWDVKTGDFIRNLVALESGGSGGVVWRIRANETKLVCAVGSRNGTEETKLLVLDFDVEVK